MKLDVTQDVEQLVDETVNWMTKQKLKKKKLLPSIICKNFLKSFYNNL